jgi:hypothetical protein
MRELTLRTGTRQEMPLPAMKMKERLSHPAPARPARSLPKAYISRRSMWFYSYAKTAYVKWYRANEIIGGRLNSGTRFTPLLSLHLEKPPRVSHGHLSSMVLPRSERIKARHGMQNIMVRRVMEKTIVRHEAKKSESISRDETKLRTHHLPGMALDSVSRPHISRVDVTPRINVDFHSANKQHARNPVAAPALSLSVDAPQIAGCDPISAGKVGINPSKAVITGTISSGSNPIANAPVTVIQTVPIEVDVESGPPVAVTSTISLLSNINTGNISQPKAETIMTGTKNRTTAIPSASEVQAPANLPVSLNSQFVQLPDFEPIITSQSISTPAQAKNLPTSPVRVKKVGYFGSNRRQAFQLMVARADAPPPQ